MIKKAIVRILGEVQGVNFRAIVKTKAQELKLLGYVENLNDGSVIIEVEGEEGNLNMLVSWLKENPGYSKIDNLEIKWSPAENIFENFEIRW